METSSLKENIGLVIRQHRVMLNMSQEAFAAKVGVHRTYMGAVERGERNVSLANLERTAHALGVSLSTLIFEAETLDGD